MKLLNCTLITCLILLGVTEQVHAQKGRLWLDNNLAFCKKGKATHYLDVIPSGTLYEVKMYDLNNVLRMRGSSMDPKGEIFDGLFEFYYPNGGIESKGQYMLDAKVGVWDRYDMRGNNLAERTYAAFDASRMAYTYVDEMPEYEGGNKSFEDFLKQKISHLVNENELADNGLDIELGFVVSSDGEIEEIEFIKGRNPEWNVAVLEELKALPSWIPGRKSGDEVRVFVRIPINLSR